ncbi:MAG: DUF4249 domain-containing protein [Saprospiraceae bacterium]
MRNFLFFIIITAFLASCSEDFFDQTIDIDPPAYDKQLVTHALVSNRDSSLSLPLTRNFGILDQVPDSAWAVKNALVEIYEEGQLKLIVPSSGSQWYSIFLLPGFFQPGKSYELRASHPDFSTVSARQVMPGPFQIDSTAYRENAGLSSEGDELSAIDVYLQDQAGVKNYYVIAADGLYPSLSPKFDTLGFFIGYDTLGYSVTDIQAESPEDPNVRKAVGNAFAVTDQAFDGQAYKFTFRTYRGYGYTNFRAHVWSVTEDYYRYAVSAQRKYDSEEVPLVEPVTVYHNLENGIGIFGLGWEELRQVGH